MSQRALISVVILFCLKIASVSAQVPTLDPPQTVNTATGEMGFSLPLGVVKGNNGHDAPIMLNYQAGIQYRQPASNIGLGFSMAAGTINRQTVIIPDELKPSEYVSTSHYKTEIPVWYWIATGILCVISIIMSIFQQHYGWGFVIGMAMAITGAAANLVLSRITFGSQHYIAGGGHVPTLTTDERYLPYGYRYGIDNSECKDLPDIFTVSTPYISGQMYWDRKEHCFKMRQCGGSPMASMRTVKIDYDNTNKFFTIVTPDGVKLEFKKVEFSNPDVYTFHQQYQNEYNGGSNVPIYATIHFKTKVPVINNWFLTSVTFNDYVDANNNQTVDAADRGSWIIYNYGEDYNADAMQLPFNQQASTNATTVPLNYGLHYVFLTEIKTPFESAVFDYRNSRLDDLWFTSMYYTAMTEDRSSGISNQRRDKEGPAFVFADSWHSAPDRSKANPVNRVVLDKISIYGKGGERGSIQFKQDYSLRPKTYSSLTKDPAGNFVTYDEVNNQNDGSLTLKSIEFYGPLEHLGDITFNYSELNPRGWRNSRAKPPFPNVDNYGNGIPRVAYNMEEKDLWGYYYPIDALQENNVFPWEVLEMTNPYAEAWSMRSVSFPTGMRISWEYESNKYDKSNDISCNRTGGFPRVGGGIRVKRVVTNDGRGNDYSLDYFYTTGTQLEEWTDTDKDTSNSSGYVPVHPYDYIADNDQDKAGDGKTDYRTSLNLPKGGLYTPTKVCYEMVKVAKNYDRIRHSAPLGYTSQQYTSTIEYPNSGEYSDIDRSVVRGLPIKTAVYDKNGNLISKDTTEYNIIANPAPIFNQMPDYWINVKNTKQYTNGIETEKQMVYAQEGTKDAVVSEKQVPLDNYYKEMNLSSFVGYPDWDDIYNRCGGDFELGSFYGNSGKKDLIGGSGIMRHDGDGWYIFRRYFLLTLGEDIEFSTSQTYNWKYCLLKYPFKEDVGNSDTSFIDAFAIADLNSNGKLDAVIFEADATYKKISYRVGFDIEPALFTESGSTVEMASLNVAHPTDLTFDAENDLIACAGIRNIVANTSKDLVLILYFSGVKQYQIVVLAGFKADGTYTKVYKSDLIPGTDGPYAVSVDGEGISAEIVNIDGSYPDLILTKFAEPRIKKIFEEIRISDSPDKVLFVQKPERLKYPVGGIQSVGFTGVRGKVFAGAVYPDDGEYSYQKPIYPGIELLRAGPFFCTQRIIGTTPVYFDYDGQPNRIIDKRGSFEIVSDAIPAYWEYPQMGTAETHLLTPTSRNASYQNMEDGPNWVSASVATWGQNGNFWFPKANYVWKVNMNSQGITNEIPPIFYYTNHALNDWNIWKLVDSTGWYNGNRNFVESFKPGVQSGARIGSVAVVTKEGLQTAQIANANFKECAVFTGEYDLNENGYFDLENGWEKGEGNEGNVLPAPLSTKSKSARHFGYAGVHVHNAFGPTRNVKLTKNRDYILSAWVKPVEGNLPIESKPELVMGLDYRMCRDPGGTVWPIPLYAVPSAGANPDEVRQSRPCSGKSTFTKYGDWYFVKMKVPASVDLKDWWDAGYQYARFWVGCPKGNGNPNVSLASATVYVADIRFYPSNALVSSTYFDEYRQMRPVLNVDANNNPGKKIVYDDFGRVSEIRKVEKTNPSSTTLLEKKEYHLHSDLLQTENYKILYPDGNESFVPNEKILISWTQRNESTVKLVFKKESDGSTVDIITQSFSAGKNEYQWEIPAGSSGYYKICLMSSTGSTLLDASDGKFKVETVPNAVVLTSPANNATGVSRTGVVLEWSCSDNDGDALKYIIHLATNDYNYPFTSSTTSFTIPITLDANRAYMWYIYAEDPAGHKVRSGDRFFTTE